MSVKKQAFGVILRSNRGLEDGCWAVEHFRLPASPVSTLGIGSQLSKYWNVCWGLMSSLSIGIWIVLETIDGTFLQTTDYRALVVLPRNRK